MTLLETTLVERFRCRHFSSNVQRDATMAIFSTERDVFITWPSGAGRSICYQVPATCLPGITIVVSNQTPDMLRTEASALCQLGVMAHVFHPDGAIRTDDISSVVSGLSKGLNDALTDNLKLLYTTLNVASTPGFRKILAKIDCTHRVSRLVVDNCEMISRWNSKKKVSKHYLKLGELRNVVPRVPLICVAENVTTIVRNEIFKLMDMKFPVLCFDHPPTTENQHLQVVCKEHLHNPIRNLKGFLKRELLQHQSHTDCGVIYCKSDIDCTRLESDLYSGSYTIASLHDKQSTDEQMKIKSTWQRNIISVLIVCMSVDFDTSRRNIRFVIHWDMPDSVASYCRQMSIALSHSQQTLCRLYYSAFTDPCQRANLVRLQDVNSVKLKHAMRIIQTRYMIDYCNSLECRHQWFGRYFDQDVLLCGHSCDYCLDESKVKEMVTAIKIITNQERTPNPKLHTESGINNNEVQTNGVKEEKGEEEEEQTTEDTVSETVDITSDAGEEKKKKIVVVEEILASLELRIRHHIDLSTAKLLAHVKRMRTGCDIVQEPRGERIKIEGLSEELREKFRLILRDQYVSNLMCLGETGCSVEASDEAEVLSRIGEEEAFLSSSSVCVYRTKVMMQVSALKKASTEKQVINESLENQLEENQPEFVENTEQTISELTTIDSTVQSQNDQVDERPIIDIEKEIEEITELKRSQNPLKTPVELAETPASPSLDDALASLETVFVKENPPPRFENAEGSQWTVSSECMPSSLPLDASNGLVSDGVLSLEEFMPSARKQPIISDDLDCVEFDLPSSTEAKPLTAISSQQSTDIPLTNSVIGDPFVESRSLREKLSEEISLLKKLLKENTTSTTSTAVSSNAASPDSASSSGQGTKKRSLDLSNFGHHTRGEVDDETAPKHRKKKSDEVPVNIKTVSEVVIELLNPYYLEKRVASKDLFKALAKKLSHAVLDKRLCSLEEVRSRAKAVIKMGFRKVPKIKSERDVSEFCSAA